MKVFWKSGFFSSWKTKSNRNIIKKKVDKPKDVNIFASDDANEMNEKMSQIVLTRIQTLIIKDT